MAVKTYTQSQLNNNMSGTDANAIYYATHGGTGNANLVSSGNQKKTGNYTSVDKNGNLTYTIGAGPTQTTTPTKKAEYTPVAVDYDDSDYSYGGGGGGGDEGYYEDPGAGFDYGAFISDMLLNQKANADYI